VNGVRSCSVIAVRHALLPYNIGGVLLLREPFAGTQANFDPDQRIWNVYQRWIRGPGFQLPLVAFLRSRSPTHGRAICDASPKRPTTPSACRPDTGRVRREYGVRTLFAIVRDYQQRMRQTIRAARRAWTRRSSPSSRVDKRAAGSPVQSLRIEPGVRTALRDSVNMVPLDFFNDLGRRYKHKPQ